MANAIKSSMAGNPVYPVMFVIGVYNTMVIVSFLPIFGLWLPQDRKITAART